MVSTPGTIGFLSLPMSKTSCDAFRQIQLADLFPGDRGCCRNLDLDDLQSFIDHGHKMGDGVGGNSFGDIFEHYICIVIVISMPSFSNRFLVFGVSYSRDCAWHIKFMFRYLAGDEVIFIISGHCDEHVGTFRSCFFQHCGFTAVAVEANRPQLIIDDIAYRGIFFDTTISCPSSRRALER